MNDRLDEWAEQLRQEKAETQRLREQVADLESRLDRMVGSRDEWRASCHHVEGERDKVFAQVADLTAKLAAGRQWTNEQPRTPGWYWWKGRPDVRPDVHYVSEQDIAEGNPPGLWCGPLEEP